MSRSGPGPTAGAALLLLLAAAGPAAAGPDCSLGSGLHLVGMDTASGEALLSLPGTEGGSYLVAWRHGAERARAVREAEAAGRFGGSVGPGPVFAFARCGRGCLQPLQLEDGGWRPLGEPILAPHAATVHGTYDLDGTPWVAIHGSPHTAGDRADARAGFVTAWAFRLQDREWRPAGSMDVTAVAVPGALPAPWLPDAIVSGTGLFSAAGEPRAWVTGLPAGRGGPGSQLLPFGRGGGASGTTAAAFLSVEGVVYRSADSGGSWQLASWRPWDTGTAEPWQRGDDYSVDLATGVPGAALPVLWFDRRLVGRERLVFSEMTPAGAWRAVATGPARLPTSAGEELTVTHVLRGPGDRWTALFGCVASGGRPRLVVVEVTAGEVGAARLVPVEAAAPVPR